MSRVVFRGQPLSGPGDGLSPLVLRRIESFSGRFRAGSATGSFFLRACVRGKLDMQMKVVLGGSESEGCSVYSITIVFFG